MAIAGSLHEHCMDHTGVLAVDPERWPPGAALDEAHAQALQSGHHGDPAAVLGCVPIAGRCAEGHRLYVVRVWHP